MEFYWGRMQFRYTFHSKRELGLHVGEGWGAEVGIERRDKNTLIYWEEVLTIRTGQVERVE